MSMYRSRKRMENVDAQVEQKPSFEVKKTIDQAPFREEAVRSFFSKWCEINDSIVPQIASREYWEQHIKEQGILSKNPDGTSNLFMPNDLHLWEMVGFIEAIDKDTFAAKPELREKKKQEFISLGKMFRNSGIYLAQRINSITDGKPIAKDLAREFFRYGNSLITGYMDQEQTEIPIETIAINNQLNFEETEQVDKWLAGEKLYKSRMERVKKEIATHTPEETDQIIENEREYTLRQFFRISEKALLRERKDPQSFHTDKEKPWSSAIPIHSAFLQKIQESNQRSIQAPKTELLSSIFNRGTEKLLTEMEGPNTHRLINTIRQMLGSSETRKLTAILNVDQLKQDLREVRKKGDVEKISKKELEIAQKIQRMVRRFPYKEFSQNPSDIVKNKEINCLGATILTGALLNEIGINYLQVTIPDHAIIILITTDSRAFWQDIQMPYRNGELHDKDIQRNTKDAKDIAINDIVAFSKKPTLEGLLFKLEPSVRRKKMPWSTEEQQYVYVLPPEAGQQAGLLANLSGLLRDSGLTKESVEALKLEVELAPRLPSAQSNLAANLINIGRYEEALDYVRRAIELNPQNYVHYYHLGVALFRLGRYQEAITAYNESITINPEYEGAYNGLANIASSLNKNDEALIMYRKAIEINPKSRYPHDGLANIFMKTGRYEEALREYKKFILLANKDVDESLIEGANKKIRELEEKISQK